MAENEDKGLLGRVCYLIATVGLVGNIKHASGTIGSLVALPIAWAVISLGGVHMLLIYLLLLIIVGHVATAQVLKTTDETDPSFIVIDEVIGQTATFVVPVIFFPNYEWLVVMYIGAFALFRFFDIMKPLHVGEVDRNLHGALGVMLDDIVAAFYASVALTVLMLIYQFVFALPIEAM